MCGIAAIFGYRSAAPVDRQEIRTIRDAMALRGPDGVGEWFSSDGRAGLGHRRLSIIDLSPEGAQPMAIDDGRITIVFNGEIYNYRTLRASLEREGCRFRSTSDTEVILRLYERRGEQAIRELRGMFTLALWDGRRGGLLLARDPFGIKPLYYADDGSTLRVASQVKALLSAGTISLDPDPAGVAGFFVWGSVPEPHTLYRAIRELPAGHVMWTDERGLHEPRPFFVLSKIFLPDAESDVHRERGSGQASRDRSSSGSFPEEESSEQRQLHRDAGATEADAAHEGLSALARKAFLDSVRHHLIADVEVGAFLSAGIDSSAIVSLAREVNPGSLRTITLGFEEFRGTPQDEAPIAEDTARRLGTRHETRMISRARFLKEVPRVIESMDQPTVDGVNSYFVCQAAAEAGLKVALSGLGGDELLGGYATFRDLPWIVRGASVPSRIPGLGWIARPVLSPLLGRRIPARYANLFELGGSYAGAYRLRRGLFAAWELPDLIGKDLAVEGLRALETECAPQRALEPDPGSPFARVSVLEASLYMRNQLLRDADWSAMAHSLELRVPLVDATLWRTLARTLGPSGRSHGKALLASAPRPPLPIDLVNRKKTGFSIPVWEWIGSSKGLDGWRRVKALNGPGFQGARRWAYVLFDSFAGHLSARVA